jgi:citrate lyase subunit beta/citryl-CoA lyase
VDVDLFAIRSVLFLPASNPRAIDKARGSAADLVVLDLEDAVRPDDKEMARAAAVEAVAGDWPMPVAVRINGTASKWHGADLSETVRCRNEEESAARTAARDRVHGEGFLSLS